VRRRGIRLTLVTVFCAVTWGGAIAVPAAMAAPLLGDPCPNADIRSAQRVASLPDCMALEQVSPQLKNSQPARILYVNPVFGISSGASISPSGDRVLFITPAALAETPGLQEVTGDWYVASRDPGHGGWLADHTSPPPGMTRGMRGVPIPADFNADLSQWFNMATTREQWENGLGQAFRAGLGGSFQAFSPLLTPLSGTPSGVDGQVQFEAHGSPADSSRFYFVPNPTITYLPSDPTPAGFEGRNVYIALRNSSGNPTVQLLARDGTGKVWGGDCGAVVGGNSSAARNLGAISVDGSRTYFSTRPGQSSPGACDSFSNMKRIMVREDLAAGTEIRELFESECDRVADPGPPEVLACGRTMTGSAPPLGGNVVPDSDDIYQGASIEGTRVYFTTGRQLVDSDINGLDSFFGLSGCVGFFGFGIGGCDLYLYDATKPAGERLTQVTADSSGESAPNVVAASGDGSRVYFNSSDVLTVDSGPGGEVASAGQNNLYAYDADSDELSFIAITSASSAYPVPVLGPDTRALGVGGDGRLFFFASAASLTSNDTDGGFSDVYRYDAERETLARISQAHPDGIDNGPYDAIPGAQLGAARDTNSTEDSPSTDFAGRGRWVSEDGETVAFKTRDRLVPDDSNGVLDSYMWRRGTLVRLPGTADATNGLINTRGLQDKPLVSADGSTVAFQTYESLLPRDGDTAIDVYVARVGGGFAEPPAEELCVPDGKGGCQGAAGAAPVELGVASATFAGRGDIVEKAPKRPCSKNKRKVRRNGKVRCVPRKAASGGKGRKNTRERAENNDRRMNR